MSFTASRTVTSTFTIIHARALASKVAADLHLCAQYYGNPSEADTRAYAEELAQYLNAGYLEAYEFGYKKNGVRVVTWRYRVDASGSITADDRAGKVVPYVDVAGATFYNCLTSNVAFALLSAGERVKFERELPVQRTPGTLPSDGLGTWTSDRNYSSGGVALGRQTFQPAL